MKTNKFIGVLASTVLLMGCSVQDQNVDLNLPPTDTPPDDAPQVKELPPDKGPAEEAKTVNPTNGVLDGPYWQDLQFAYSTNDGWSEAKTIVEHASGPDAIVVHKDVGPYREGDILVILTYFYENKVGSDYLAFMHSSDNGETWSSPSEIKIEGMSHLPVDASIYQADDGSLLLTYQDLKKSNDQSDEYSFYLAKSTDGESFSYQGEIFRAEEFFIHPDLIYFNDQWLLFYSADWGNRKIWVSKSDDYMDFTVGTELNFEGMPGVIATDEQLEIFGCDKQKGIIIVSTEDADNYSEALATGLSGCAPSPVVMQNGERGIIMTHSSK